MVNHVHHIGCLVSSIEESIIDYKLLYPTGEVSEIYYIQSQKVRVCFFSLCNTKIEFVEPTDPNSPLIKMINKNINYYHIGLLTNDINGEIERLEQCGYRLLNLFRSEAFNGNHCAFLYNNNLHMIELIEI